MHVILARHGNTFGPDDKVVWLGAHMDPPLVDKGRQQALAIGLALGRCRMAPQRIYAAPGRRTQETATIVADALQVAHDHVATAGELVEIDYGLWEGHSNDDIRRLHGHEAIDGWQKRSLWPEGFGWQPGEAALRTAWQRLMGRVAAENGAGSTVLMVSSIGICRLAAKLLGLAPEATKMATGALAHLVMDGTTIRVSAWNVLPADLLVSAG